MTCLFQIRSKRQIHTFNQGLFFFFFFWTKIYFFTELPSSYGLELLPLNTAFGACPLFEVIIVPRNGKLQITVYQKEINTLD